MKRVVTGLDATGESRILRADDPDAAVTFGPGFAVHEVWRIDDLPRSPGDGHAPSGYNFEPEGGAIFRVVHIPPDEVAVASLERGDRWGANSPYTRTGDDYGMHQTNTLDLVTVTSGLADLQMPDGTRERLQPGDVVVQGGATHAWRNPGPDTLVLHVVMLGVGRRS